MKRSEMIKIIELAIGLPRIEFSASTIARDILDLIEHHGMQPPEIETTHWNRQDNNYHMSSEWEREDLGPHKIIPAVDFDSLFKDLIGTENEESGDE